MNEQEFKASLDADGFAFREAKLEPNVENPDHTHPWHARLLIVEGEFTLITAEGENSMGPGDTCAVSAGTVHAERTGTSGASLLVGTKDP